MKFQYLGVDHIGLAVADLGAAKKVYGDVLGLEATGGETLEDRGLEVSFYETGNARVELLGETRPDSEISKFLQKRGEGIHHICLKVTDLEAAVAHLQEEGAKLIGEAPQAGAHGTKVAFVHPKSTHGVLLELVEAKSE